MIFFEFLLAFFIFKQIRRNYEEKSLLSYLKSFMCIVNVVLFAIMFGLIILSYVLFLENQDVANILKANEFIVSYSSQID